MQNEMSEEFFIGWQGKAPEKTGRFLKKLTIVTALGAVAIAAALPALQQSVSEDARFDYGNLQDFSGILVKDPVPMLISDFSAAHNTSPHPGGDTSSSHTSTFPGSG